MSDCCVYCGEELSLFEKNRSECWNCQDIMSVTYSDDLEEQE
ncbi:hypothetical protein [Ammoniphilus sp. 3BR4]